MWPSRAVGAGAPIQSPQEVSRPLPGLVRALGASPGRAALPMGLDAALPLGEAVTTVVPGEGAGLPPGSGAQSGGGRGSSGLHPGWLTTGRGRRFWLGADGTPPPRASEGAAGRRPIGSASAAEGPGGAWRGLGTPVLQHSGGQGRGPGAKRPAWPAGAGGDQVGTGRGPCGHLGTPALTGQAGRLGAPGLMGETCPASGAAGLGWRGHPAAPAYLLPPPGRPLPISFLPPFASCARLLTLKGWGVDSAGVWGVRVRVCPRLCVCTCVCTACVASRICTAEKADRVQAALPA